MSLRPRQFGEATQPHSQGPSLRWTLGDLPFVGMPAGPTTPSSSRPRMKVKLMGGKTVDAASPFGWDAVMADKAGAFEKFYGQLTSKLSDHNFDFYTDGDPPDKEDDWKVFTAYVAAKPGNSLTIVRKDDSKRDERIKLWQDKLDVANAANAAKAAAAEPAGAADAALGQTKGVQNVFLHVAPKGITPRNHTLSICDVALVVNIAKESVVFDAENPGKLGPMKDGGNFEQFQIRQGAWTVPNKGSSRPILRPTELQQLETGILDRAGMAEFIADRGFDQVVVKSQGQIELENDFVTGWAPVGDVSGTFKMYEKGGLMPKTFTPRKEAVEEAHDTIFGKPLQ